jgi:hypothetical protein
MQQAATSRSSSLSHDHPPVNCSLIAASSESTSAMPIFYLLI